MRKYLILTMGILLISVNVYASGRGVMTNVFASWYNVSQQRAITLPFPSRDIYVRNGSSVAVCLDLLGGTTFTQDAGGTGDRCVSSSVTQPSIIQIGATSDFRIVDFRTTALTLDRLGATASPVTVIITY